MIPTWCMAMPNGSETGSYLAIDLGGTNLRVCKITLLDEPGAFEIIQDKYRLAEGLKRGPADDMWDYIAECVQQFLSENGKSCGGGGGDGEREENAEVVDLPLGFTFSYPVTQDSVDHGILQRWTKGWDVKGVEGEDVVPQFQRALEKLVSSTSHPRLITSHLIPSHLVSSQHPPKTTTPN